ncbi:hypothetical protein KSC_004330 [Ktedonobacter sp. SOSP1-52]|uniref:protein-tyrosine phosphatase family protein n=1 Tax=Ktedonobacter sp. SOSP1-52 TaxID=2778366 RepID=UPI001914E2C0|nr:protein-tyrosine phosphatase family protein [Ktedonobacter sp. SOSP1-52]GHO61455.1 hypothetical protein KSC_003470 [Ktedonobacter sp. SOSP1-52]GHO61541.1 hypothetical protein KSC_004330 [Ktedonobacter sp. SOSP1-52]
MRAQLSSLHELSAGCISTMARPRGGDWLMDEITALREAGVHVLVSLLTPLEVDAFELAEEAACCQTQDISFFSFPIIDRSVPPLNDRTLALLQQLDEQRMQGKHIALHCRQGLGRAALMAASLLVLADWSPEKAFEHLSRVRGYPVPETEEQRAWVMALATRYFAE